MNINQESISIDELRKLVTRMYDESMNPVWGINLRDLPIDLITKENLSPSPNSSSKKDCKHNHISKINGVLYCDECNQELEEY